jgi:phage repressor protein C with HTH and peptisase S24 domain
MESKVSKNQRLKKTIDYLKKERKIFNNADFSKILKKQPSYISECLHGKREISELFIHSIVSGFPELNKDWLLTGEGEMLKNNEVPSKVPTAPQSPTTPTTTTTGTTPTPQGIPLIPIEAMAGFGTGEFIIEDNAGIERFVVPTFKGADYLIHIKGSSMYPKYNSGDIVACKKLSLTDIFFQWNKVYVLDTEQGALIKRIHKSENDDCVLCISDNPNYAPFELKKSKINAIAIVMGVIRLE